MRVKIKFLLSTAVATAALFLASTASASMHYFAELLTSDLMTSAPNYQMIVESNLDSQGYITEQVSQTMTADAGLTLSPYNCNIALLRGP